MKSEENEIKHAAYHEAGHAVVAISLGYSVSKVKIYKSIHPDRPSKWDGCFKPELGLGQKHIGEEHKASSPVEYKDRVCIRILIAFAGQCSEEIEFGGCELDDAMEDDRDINEYLHRLDIADNEKTVFRSMFREQCKAILKKHWDGLKSLAEELEKKKQLDDSALTNRIKEKMNLV